MLIKKKKKKKLGTGLPCKLPSVKHGAMLFRVNTAYPKSEQLPEKLAKDAVEPGGGQVYDMAGPRVHTFINSNKEIQLQI